MHDTHIHVAPGGAGEASFFGGLFDTSFVSRAECFNQDAQIIWLHVVSDAVTAAAYYSIPLALVYFVMRRRDLAFHWMFLLFGAFILLCGTTHVFDILAVWQPMYRLDGTVKALTGIVSIGTAAALWPMIPRALTLPSPTSLRVANQALEREVLERRAAQEELQRARDELEARVEERTAALAAANRELEQRIADHKAAQEELANHRDRLEDLVADRTRELGVSHERLRLTERMAALGTLAAGLGHDMGNLLLPVRTHLESIQGLGDELPPAAAEDLVVIRKCVQHLQRLAAGLRLFARDPSDGDAEAGVTNLAHWWSDVEPFFRGALPRRIRLEVDIARDAGAAAVAPHRLTQAVFNLVQNAGEAILLAAAEGAQEAGWVRIFAKAGPDGETVVVGVSDSGPGMTPEVKARCMEPFFSTKTRAISTGLGLALVHGIVEAAGGSIAIASAPGCGTTVTLLLPAAVGVPQGDRRRAVVTLAAPRERSFIADLLRELGFAVEVGQRAGVSGAAVWVMDADAADAAAARSLLDASPAPRLIVLGEPPGDWIDRIGPPGRAGVHLIDNTVFSPARLRDGLRAALQDEGAPT